MIAFLYFPITFKACTLFNSVARWIGARFFSFKTSVFTGLEKKNMEFLFIWNERERMCRLLTCLTKNQSHQMNRFQQQHAMVCFQLHLVHWNLLCCTFMKKKYKIKRMFDVNWRKMMDQRGENIKCEWQSILFLFAPFFLKAAW